MGFTLACSLGRDCAALLLLKTMEAGEIFSAWEEFRKQIKNEIFSDSLHTSSSKQACFFHQRRSLANYLDWFKNLVVSITGTANIEKLKGFPEVLEDEI